MAIKSARTETTSGRIVNKRGIVNPRVLVSTSTPTISYVIVGGGGGGSINNFPGSGGPGGAFELATDVSVSSGQTYSANVGAGGAGYSGAGNGNGSDGSPSSFGAIRTANGGDVFGTFQTQTVLYSGTTYTGGNGAGGSGSGGNAQGTGSKDGGNGRQDTANITSGIATAGGSIYGISASGSYYYGGGGGNGNGGLGTHGGGNGTGAAGGVQNGAANSGGGGGGGSNVGGTARTGGSGVVIVRYSAEYRNAVSTTGSPSFVNDGTYKYYTFTGSGSIVF